MAAVALAMAHTILKEKLVQPRQFFSDTWANCSTSRSSVEAPRGLHATVGRERRAPCLLRTSPASRVSSPRPHRVPRPCATAGRARTYNGYWNDRAIGLLNVLVGSVGKHGGWCWMWTGGYDKKRFKAPKGAPKPKTPAPLVDPGEFVLANRWNTMRVGEIVYLYLQQERAKIQVYMSYNLDSPLTWPEMDVTKNVLLDEKKIGFHVCVNPFFNETSSFADMVLPWTTFMERWDVDARGAYNLKPYLSMRRPMVESLGEAKDVREIFPELARRIGGGMEKWYPKDRSIEEYMTEWTKDVPYDKSKYDSPMAFLEAEGAYEDPKQKAYFEPYLQPLSADDMKGAETDPKTGIITKGGKGIGIMVERSVAEHVEASRAVLTARRNHNAGGVVMCVAASVFYGFVTWQKTGAFTSIDIAAMAGLLAAALFFLVRARRAGQELARHREQSQWLGED